MIVIATKDGFYGSFRRAGNEFEVEDGLEASWFEPKESASADGDGEGEGEESAKGTKAKGAGKQS
mgnify:CR=1 FL=1